VGRCHVGAGSDGAYPPCRRGPMEATMEQDEDRGTSIVAHVDHLRGIAALDHHTTLLEMAMLNVLDELAAEVDRLTRLEDERGLGSV
jgi:hypothetical protein